MSRAEQLRVTGADERSRTDAATAATAMAGSGPLARSLARSLALSVRPTIVSHSRNKSPLPPPPPPSPHYSKSGMQSREGGRQQLFRKDFFVGENSRHQFVWSFSRPFRRSVRSFSAPLKLHFGYCAETPRASAAALVMAGGAEATDTKPSRAVGNHGTSVLCQKMALVVEALHILLSGIWSF